MKVYICVQPQLHKNLLTLNTWKPRGSDDMLLTSLHLPNIYDWLSFIASSHKYVCHPLRAGLQKLFLALQSMNIESHCSLKEEAPTFWKIILKSVIWPYTHTHTEVIFNIFDAHWENITWYFYCPSVLLTMLLIYTWYYCKSDRSLWLESWWSLAVAVSLSGCVIKPPPTHDSQPRLQKFLLIPPAANAEAHISPWCSEEMSLNGTATHSSKVRRTFQKMMR